MNNEIARGGAAKTRTLQVNRSVIVTAADPFQLFRRSEILAQYYTMPMDISHIS